jgi:putative acetyltransferase
MIVRPMADGDLPAMLDLWVAAWQATMPQIDFAARRDWLADRLATFASEGVTILCAADAAGAVAGFVTIDRRTAYLDQLAVAPSRFGNGVAATLLRAAKRESPQRIELLVNQDNPRAIRFYEREGFVRVEPTTSTATVRPLWRMRWPRGHESSRLKTNSRRCPGGKSSSTPNRRYPSLP